MELIENNLQHKVNPVSQPQQKEKPHWTYYLICTTEIYIKSINNINKSGTAYNSYYFYYAKNNQEILKFSTPTWNCFNIWDGEDRFMLLRVDKTNTNETTIKMVQQLESIKASEVVHLFKASDVFDSLVLDDCGDDSNDCEDYDD